MITRVSLLNELDDIANDASHPLAKDDGVADAAARAAAAIRMRLNLGPDLPDRDKDGSNNPRSLPYEPFPGMVNDPNKNDGA